MLESSRIKNWQLRTIFIIELVVHSTSSSQSLTPSLYLLIFLFRVVTVAAFPSGRFQ